MSHSFYVCPICDDTVPLCDCCESEDGHYCTEVALEDARFRAGMTALSRFMVWVWMEADAHWPSEPEFVQDSRMVSLWFALETGRLTLAWPKDDHHE